jgi:hypothetical protein
MVPVEARMLAYIERRLEQGALSVTGIEIMDAVVPRDHPEFRRPTAMVSSDSGEDLSSTRLLTKPARSTTSSATIRQPL